MPQSGTGIEDDKARHQHMTTFTLGLGVSGQLTFQDDYKTASSGDFLLAAAIQGLGIALEPTFNAGEAISRGQLVPLLTEYRWPVSPAWAVYPPTRHLSYRVRAFIDYLAEYFSGTPAWDKDCPGI